MDERTGAAIAAVARPPGGDPNGFQVFSADMRRFPTVARLRAGARASLPGFAFEYGDGGAGEDRGIARNWAALDAIELVPRYGVTRTLPPLGIELLGRRYGAPFGVAPMGGPAFVWPGADELLASAAQAAGIPYVFGVAGGTTLERAAELAPDVIWFQLYRFARNDHAVGFDMVRRAEAAGVHALVLTLDVPVRTTRPREIAAGITVPLKKDLALMASLAASPRWLMAMARHGMPRFAMLRQCAGEGADLDAVMAFVRDEMAGAFTWDEVGRYRDRWNRALVVKGILHPDDAERAVALGADAIVVSNHGGRQIEPLPAAIDALPAVVARVGDRVPVLMDSGIRSGADVVRALALGARAVFLGKAFLWGLGALGERGPAHVVSLLADETRAALGQIGAATPAAAREVVVRHPGALRF
jgi:L-lactate dehydrogenase (cytochrome)